MTCTVLAIEYRTPAALHAAFMPLFEYGGLFVRGQSCDALNRQFFLLLTLPGDREPLATLARSAWIQPASNAAGLPAGVGLCFEPGPEAPGQHIERLLASENLIKVPRHTF